MEVPQCKLDLVMYDAEQKLYRTSGSTRHWTRYNMSN